ncbi:TIGR02584 family CRISPR-associated protein [Thiopseudomonas alkaliphila]|uniref:TIGR02584 family CRISPR-associated protein n=1 Tax=Thiopseudomonas alkaliphila TaxID=1697053 RepID=A0AAW7DUH2_9GAMM|nr:CRISPR-associated ring nuclease Csm6 [Thiopseudomonas alkaliphila]MDM1697277.1 TIGR02584 family CRISPR-associated protein [Thiopseudomonas alkaliphila]
MKTILLSIMGTSPQVLTETLYAIHMQGKPFPDEVYLITSVNAKAKAVEWLLEKGQIEHLKTHHNLPDFKFELSHILLMEHDNGEAVYDGREEEDQQSIADSITRIVAKFTVDENCQIHASIAGGRKTMAFYMGYAMSMFGREQDVLSHVFVSKEFEFLEQFFFPTLNDNYITKGDKVLNAKEAKVTLAEIPFVRMRNMVDPGFINQMEHNSFSQSIALLNAYKNKKIKVEVATRKKCLIVNGIEVKLPPKELAFYLWLSKQPLRQINVGRQFCSDPVSSASYLKTYSMIAGDSRVFASFNVDREDVEGCSEESLSKLPALQPFEKDWLQQTRSKINGQLKKWLDESLASAIEIKSHEHDTQLHEVRYFISESLVVEHDLEKEESKVICQANSFAFVL